MSMQKLLTVMFGLGAASLLAACGGTDTTTSGTTSTASGMEQGVNGCVEATAEDHSNDMGGTSITFGGTAGFVYSPACVKITKGHQVIFKGDFSTHPLTGGEVTGSTATPDTSTIGEDSMGMADDPVNFPASGTFPFYCKIHGSIGMKGAIFVK
jgi:plastocyanin